MKLRLVDSSIQSIQHSTVILQSQSNAKLLIMAIFQVTSLHPDKTRLNDAVEKHIAESDRYPLNNNSGWLVSYSGTSVELSHFLGVSNPDKKTPSSVGSALIVTIDNYYGRGSSEMWEWLKTKFEQL